MAGEQDRAVFFDGHPDPMWIYDTQTLYFLDVNQAAISNYGYTREEFLEMTITDIRPTEDLSSLIERVKSLAAHDEEAGIWRHRLKSNQIIYVNIHSRDFSFRERQARLVSARNVTRQVQLDIQNKELLASEQSYRRAAETAVRHFQSLLEVVPGNFAVVTPDDFRIVAVTDTYLKLTMTIREEVIGRRLLDVFPDDPNHSFAQGVKTLLASLERVKSERISDVMEVLRYPIPVSQPSIGFEERFWSIVNTPVNAEDGEVAFIIIRIEDVSDVIHRGNAETEKEGAIRLLEDRATNLSLDILFRAKELQAVNERLEQKDANLRTAQRLLTIGIWSLNMETRSLKWSDNVYGMYGISREMFGGTFESYLSIAHPDDAAEMRARYAAFEASTEVEYKFEHRVLSQDGKVVYVRGVGELIRSTEGRILSGVVQDITNEVEAKAEELRNSSFLRMASNAARVGAWRFDVRSDQLTMNIDTANLFNAGTETSVTLDFVIQQCEPEYRHTLSSVMHACLQHGKTFDEVVATTARAGDTVWIRMIGEAGYDPSGRIIAMQGAVQDVTERIKDREETERLSHSLTQTLESINYGFLILDRQWRFSYVNGWAERLLRRNRDDLLGKVYWEEFPKSRGTNIEAQYNHAMTTGQVVNFTEHSHLGPWFEVNVHPGPEGLAVYFRDVTEERARAEQLRLLETAVSRINDILLITEAEPMGAPEGPRIVYVNDAFVRRTGYSREEVIGKTPRILQGPKTQRDRLDNMGRSLRAWQPSRTELINYAKDGTEFWLELEIVPIADESGWFTHWVSIERDITSRKASEEDLRESEERFRLLAEVTKGAVWDWNAISGTVWSNTGFKAEFGYDFPRDNIGLDWWFDRIDPNDRDRVRRNFTTILRSKAQDWQDEYRFLHADGEYRIVSDRGLIIRNKEHRAVRMIGSRHDVTPQRQMEELLRQSQKLEAIGQLTGGVAHDFNNLLTIILANAELLTEQLSDQAQLRLMAEMTVTAAERGAELTQRLLAFARRQPLNPKLIDINQLVVGMEGMLRRTLSEAIDIKFAQAGGLWSVELDPGQFETALLNLAVNARDAMPQGGYLTIETANIMLDDDYAASHQEVTAGQYIMVSISDNGKGMPPEVVTKAFEPFFTTKEMGKGTGLGLSMAYGFVKQSGGHIKIYSEVGEGTTIKLYFPRTKVAAASLETTKVVEARGGNGETILVVEDDHMVRMNVIRQLQSLNYNVISARNGLEALAVLEKTSNVDLLFTDIVMPGGMNGRQLADIAKERYPNLRVLFTSGYTENTIVHHGRLDPGVHLLSKPYRRQVMAAKVVEALQKPKSDFD